MLSIAITGADALTAKLDELPPTILAAVAASSASLAEQLATLVHTKLTGGVLQARTGALAGSVVIDGARIDGERVVVGISAGGDLKYAAIQEYGGTTSPHEILPSRARALAFLAGGGEAFARRVRHPGSHIPARSYLRASLAELAAEIDSAMKAAVIDAVRTRMGA